MCGIFGFFTNKSFSDREKADLLSKFRQQVKKLRHRGPDWSGSFVDFNGTHSIYIAHERLAINGLGSGSQPIMSNNIVLSVNGEIYNHQELDQHFKQKYDYQTDSDCESIIYSYLESDTIEKSLNQINGVFSFILFDQVRQTVVIARDPIGVNPLYYGYDEFDEIYFSSEMKSLDHLQTVAIVPPGTYMKIQMNEGRFSTGEPVQYYKPLWKETLINDKTEEQNLIVLRESLIKAVKKRLMTEVPFGVLLSGGLDSSLIASISQELVSKGISKDWGDRIHTFSIGLEGSPDLEAAQKVADHLGTIHHNFVFTIQEAKDALEDVIYHLETYDVTTIRASTPMYLLSRRIKAMGIKMVLSGEGSDEILGGYLYFHHAPSSEEFQTECHRLLDRLHYADCLRANKSTMAWGLEVRVPFLDTEFLDVSVPVNPELKMKDGKEKYILRQAFSKKASGHQYLPDELLWRQKEQFSDGVGYSWIDSLIEMTSQSVSDQELQNYNALTHDKISKEAYYYLKIYKRLFPNRIGIIPRWKPRMDWNGITSDDPSGRVVSVHQNKLP